MDKKFIIDSDIRKAKTLHSDYYTSDEVYYSSINKIFSSSWHLVSHIKEFSIKNILPINLLPDSISEPLVLTYIDNNIQCLSNVCTHRGHIICSEHRKAKLLSCRYHGRTFDLDGQLNTAVGFNDVLNFPTSSDSLQKIETKEWKDFIFVSLNNEFDISDVLYDISTRLKSFPFDSICFSEDLSNEFTIDAHWALYCENYLEGFHVPFVHKGLSKEINNETYDTILLKNAVLQYANSIESKKDIYGYYYWIFPNIMMNFYSWGLSINIVEPISKNKTKVRFLSYPIKIDEETRQAIRDLIEVELEDQSVVKSVQEGIKSRYYTSGRYSSKHEGGVHHFHTLLSKFI